MRRDFGGRAALTTHRYTESDDFKPQKALLAAEFAMPQNNLPGTARGARLCMSVADVLREDFDGVEATVTDNVDIGRRADHLPQGRHRSGVIGIGPVPRQHLRGPSGSVAHGDDDSNASIGMVVRQVD